MMILCIDCILPVYSIHLTRRNENNLAVSTRQIILEHSVKRQPVHDTTRNIVLYPKHETEEMVPQAAFSENLGDNRIREPVPASAPDLALLRALRQALTKRLSPETNSIAVRPRSRQLGRANTNTGITSPHEEEEVSGEEVPSSPKSNRKVAMPGMEESDNETTTVEARNPYKLSLSLRTMAKKYLTQLDAPLSIGSKERTMLSIQERARKKMHPPPEPEEDELYSKRVALTRNTKEPESDSSFVSENPASAYSQSTMDGMRIVKTTRIAIKPPNLLGSMHTTASAQFR
ncbi:unnamed protein product [Rhizoctonia solani]|uniref:Uncharacterized protein n=1 Tax=Rhizoctonia solani TaxID=456999 RepID=A0A8H2XJA3_9AGAM|nr:unnamed protein product [Rhizoctonia solani]